MKWFEDSHREQGHYNDNNKALVDYLYQNHGVRFVKTYEELCQLAVLLQAKGYKPTNPPCTPVDFAKAFEKADPCYFGDSKPIIPESAMLQLADEQERDKKKFDHWISQKATEIQAMSDLEEMIGQACALGMIFVAQCKPKDPKQQSESIAVVSEEESDTAETNTRHRSPSFSNSDSE